MFFQQARDEAQKHVQYMSHALAERSMLMKFNVMADALWLVGNPAELKSPHSKG